MKIVIMSDIHGNQAALEAVLSYLDKVEFEQLILLGDLIDYGPHSNEVVKRINSLNIPVICNIWGNHEQAIACEEYDRFSSERGRISAKYTRSLLDDSSWNFIQNDMNKTGLLEFEVGSTKCLAVHGSLKDFYWKAIRPCDDLELYEKYDYVFSGHSHLPHYFEQFYKVDNPIARDKKKTIFINPGSVGQPRNLCPSAQFAIWDTESGEIIMAHVPYNIKQEQDAFSEHIDVFYKKRLEVGV